MVPKGSFSTAHDIDAGFVDAITLGYTATRQDYKYLILTLADTKCGLTGTQFAHCDAKVCLRSLGLLIWLTRLIPGDL